MSSFQKLWENIQTQKDTSYDDRAMSAIRTGLGVDESFWDNFLQVINNSEDLSELLDIPVVKISNWHTKIKHALHKVKEADRKTNPTDNKKLLKTGLPNEQDPHAVVMNSVK
jgi:hypothetical protein